jgi:hypothetical protein
MARLAKTLLLLGLMVAARAGLAQPAEGLVPQDVMAPSRSVAGTSVEQAAETLGIRTRMIYARSAGGQAAPLSHPHSGLQGPGVTLGFGSGQVWGVVLALVVGIALWLRFGGSGVLFARAPARERPVTEAPDHWRADLSDGAQGPADLLRRIAAMQDRRAALVRLLRHCLLRAGQECQTRFARADTEREAFGRVPSAWRSHQALGVLLRGAELAHYGGRPVDDAGFDQALAVGRDILLGRGHADG